MILNLRYKIIVKKQRKKVLYYPIMILFYLKCDFSIKEKRIKKSAIDLSTCLSTKTIIDDRHDKMFYIKSIQDLFKIFRTVFKSHLFIMII